MCDEHAFLPPDAKMHGGGKAVAPEHRKSRESLLQANSLERHMPSRSGHCKLYLLRLAETDHRGCARTFFCFEEPQRGPKRK